MFGQGYKYLTRISSFVLFKPAAITMQKVNPSAASIFVTEGFFFTFISCYLKKIIKIGFPELEKISPTISLVFRKTIA